MGNGFLIYPALFGEGSSFWSGEAVTGESAGADGLGFMDVETAAVGNYFVAVFVEFDCCEVGEWR